MDKAELELKESYNRGDFTATKEKSSHVFFFNFVYILIFLVISLAKRKRVKVNGKCIWN